MSKKRHKAPVNQDGWTVVRSGGPSRTKKRRKRHHDGSQGLSFAWRVVEDENGAQEVEIREFPGTSPPQQ